MSEKPYMSGEIIRRRAIEANSRLAQSLKDHMEKVISDLRSQGVAIWHANPDGSVSMTDRKDIWRHFCPYCGDEMATPGAMYGCDKVECREEYSKMLAEA